MHLKSNTEKQYLVNNVTDRCKPADFFAIQKLRAEWSTEWNAELMSMIEAQDRMD